MELEENNRIFPVIADTSVQLTASTIKTENVVLREPLIITIIEPASLNEQISDFNKSWGLYIELAVGIVIGGLDAIIIKKFKRKDQKNTKKSQNE